MSLLKDIIGLFKKEKIENEFFGELVLSSGYWCGTKLFKPLPESEIEIQINCIESEIGDSQSYVWTFLESEYETISKLTISEIENHAKKDWLPFDLKTDFGLKHLQLESVFIDDDNSFEISWGVMPAEVDDFEYGFQTSYVNGKIEINGFIH